MSRRLAVWGLPLAVGYEQLDKGVNGSTGVGRVEVHELGPAHDECGAAALAGSAATSKP